jgi:hypothetical protein
MDGFSVCVTVLDSELRGQGAYFYGVVLKSRLDELTITDRPAQPRAVITSRRDITPRDDAHDGALAAVARARRALDDLKTTKPIFPAEVQAKHLSIGAGPAYVYGSLPRAMLQQKRTAFRDLISRLPIGG